MAEAMTRLVVAKAGMLTTVQDLGRPGFGPVGVSPSGAADPVSLRLANALVGNLQGAAALEMTLAGGTFQFPEGAVIAIAGSDFGATGGGHALDRWIPHGILPGGVVTFGPSRSGARCYLAVMGGIQVPLVMGSASTHLLSGLGGFEGRALRSGDVLRLGIAGRKIRRRRLSAAALQVLEMRTTLRVTTGPQFNEFSREAQRMILQGPFEVSEDSNRLGLRLRGPRLEIEKGGDRITEGVSLGAIQVTPAGDAIVLFVEQQTAGGYPVIANVISADIHRVGQLRPRDKIRFEEVTFGQARAAWRELHELLCSEERLFA